MLEGLGEVQGDEVVQALGVKLRGERLRLEVHARP